MRSLETAIQSIDNQIENMYADESLHKHEYQLHAVMVHEGSIDSGHYCAYVLDHKRKVITPYWVTCEIFTASDSKVIYSISFSFYTPQTYEQYLVISN